MKKIIIDDTYIGKRLDRFLISYFKFCSKNYIYKLLRLKRIKINEKKVDAKYILKKNDVINIYVSDQQFENMIKKDLSKDKEEKYLIDDYFLSIVYEDEEIIIVQKPKDMVVIGDEKEKYWVFLDFVRKYIESKNSYSNICNQINEKDNDKKEDNDDDFAKKKEKSNEKNLIKYAISVSVAGTQLVQDSTTDENKLVKFLVSAVHRIDRNTIGLVMFAKSYQSFNDLTRLIKDRKIEKEYLAIVYGELLLPKKIILDLKKDENKNLIFVTNKENLNENCLNLSKDKSKTAITYVQPIIITKEATLIRATIETGRTHQIRVTMANSGHPIINDKKYGQKKLYESFAKKYNIDSMMLLAYSLFFEGELPSSLSNLSNLRITATLPFEWEQVLNNHFKISKSKLEELLKNLRKLK